jgi:hypothetical protein
LDATGHSCGGWRSWAKGCLTKAIGKGDETLNVGELLALPKRAIGKPREKKKASPAFRQWSIALECEGVDGRFSVAVRTNATLAESFSLVLCYQPPKGRTTVLLRVNGPHGRHRNPDGSILDGGPHAHLPTPNELDELPPEWPEGPPTAAALPEATQNMSHAWPHFAERCTISASDDVESFFRAFAQQELFP